MGAHGSLTLPLPIDAARRRRAGAETFAPYFDGAPTETVSTQGAVALTRRRLGALTLVQMAAPARSLRRTAEMAAGQGCDDLLFLFLLGLDGSARLTWPGGEADLARLQGVLLDLARPAALVAGPFRATGLVLPRALATAQVPNVAALHGAVLDPASDPVVRLFFTCVHDLAETGHALGDDQFPPMTRAVAALCVAALRRLERGLRMPGEAGSASASRHREVAA